MNELWFEPEHPIYPHLLKMCKPPTNKLLKKKKQRMHNFRLSFVCNHVISAKNLPMLLTSKLRKLG